MVDEAGFKAFVKEVHMLSTINHKNIVTFLGYSLRPALLIVMSFCNGESLTELFFSDHIRVPDSVTIRLLADVAHGMLYLHRTRPTPM